MAAPISLLGLGCAAGDTSDNLTSFGSPGYGSNGGPIGTDGTRDEDEDEDEDDSGTDDGGPSDPPSDDPQSGDSSGGEMPPGDTSGGPADPMDDGMDPMDGGMDPPPGGGAQPGVGMYAACSEDDFASCTPTQGCMTIELPTGPVGYCTAIGCLNPAADCDAAPAGSSVAPMCIPVGTDTVCALDCSAAACPTGMECLLLALDEAGTMTAEVCG